MLNWNDRRWMSHWVLEFHTCQILPARSALQYPLLRLLKAVSCRKDSRAENVKLHCVCHVHLLDRLRPVIYGSSRKQLS